ncbi:hypothetical protein [Leptothrix discophora]|uniref:Uncharacterized protein n=1 Tax=Leptothrix discophora TaxID=89 RepID=A0ABT9G2Q8_LEPDI|nr:hypothetical protein [Leptothrix discophora]MDP4300771.1 hypothetical protein [Leptothrix discophora]
MTRHTPSRSTTVEPTAAPTAAPMAGTFRARTAQVALAMGLALTGWSGLASAQTVMSFNDLGASVPGSPMPSPYQGLAFANTNWHSMTLASAPTQVFLALSGNASFLRKADGSGFYFDGADFWSRRGLDATGNFYFVLQHKGKVVYDGRSDKRGKMRFTSTATLLRPSYTGPVDYVAIAFDKPGRGGDWDQLAMDNVRMRPL